MLTLAVKCESCLCLCCAAHNINKSVPNGLPFPLSSLFLYHFLFTYLRAMKLSSPLKVCNASGGTAVAGARKLQTTKGYPLPQLPSLSLPRPAGLQLIMSKLAITATLAAAAARRSLGRLSYAWLPKYFRAAKLIYKFPLELSPARSVARTRCHMLWGHGGGEFPLGIFS